MMSHLIIDITGPWRITRAPTVINGFDPDHEHGEFQAQVDLHDLTCILPFFIAPSISFCSFTPDSAEEVAEVKKSLPVHQYMALERTSSFLIMTLPQRHSITPGMNEDCGPRMLNECRMAVQAVDHLDALCLGTASGSMPSVVVGYL